MWIERHQSKQEEEQQQKPNSIIMIWWGGWHFDILRPCWDESENGEHEQGQWIVRDVLHQGLTFHLQQLQYEVFHILLSFVSEFTLGYLRLSQPDWVTVSWDSNFFSFFISSWATLAYANGYQLKPQLFLNMCHLWLLVLAWHCLQRWDRPPQSEIPDDADHIQSNPCDIITYDC